jgi:hypothetical protein
MPGAHRDTDFRLCGARTIVTEQNSVRVNGLLWSVEDDICDHGLSGPLKPIVGDSVKIHGKKVIVFGDQAKTQDSEGHDPATGTIPLQRSQNVFAYGQG